MPRWIRDLRPTSECCLGRIPRPRLVKNWMGQNWPQTPDSGGWAPQLCLALFWFFVWRWGHLRFPRLALTWSCSSATLDLMPSCLFFLSQSLQACTGRPSFSSFLVCFGFGFPYLIYEVIFKMNLVTCPNDLSLYRRCCTRSRDESCVYKVKMECSCER